MRLGSISKQYRDRQRQRGVYYQLSYTHEMRSRTEHVWPDHVKGLRKEGLQQNLWVKFRICSGNAGRRVPLPLDPRTAETTCFMG